MCEDIASQIIDNLGVDPAMVQVLRNGIRDRQVPARADTSDNDKPVIAIIGRLSGPRGALLPVAGRGAGSGKPVRVRVVSGTQVPARFARFQDKVDFVGYVDDVPALMAGCDLVIGAGRVAMEALLCGRPAFAIGEARAIGLVTGRIWTKRLPATSATSAPGSGHRLCRAEGADPFGAGLQGGARPSAPADPAKYDLQGVVTGLESRLSGCRGRDPAPGDAGHHVSPLHRARERKGSAWHLAPSRHVREAPQADEVAGAAETLTFADLAENRFIHRLQYSRST